MPGYVHFTHDPIRDRTFIHISETNPTEVRLTTEHTQDFRSKLAGGWRNDEVFTRSADGRRRTFTLYDLKMLPAVDATDRSAVHFDASAAYLEAMNLQSSRLTMVEPATTTDTATKQK